MVIFFSEIWEINKETCIWQTLNLWPKISIPLHYLLDCTSCSFSTVHIYFTVHNYFFTHISSRIRRHLRPLPRLIYLLHNFPIFKCHLVLSLEIGHVYKQDWPQHHHIYLSNIITNFISDPTLIFRNRPHLPLYCLQFNLIYLLDIVTILSLIFIRHVWSLLWEKWKSLIYQHKSNKALKK